MCSSNFCSRYEFFLLLPIQFLYYVYLLHTQLIIHRFQGDVSKASDVACASYYENTKKPTGHGVWSAMEKAIQKCIKTIRGRSFDKMVAVANPDLGLEFENEVHFVISFLLFPYSDTK